ncbi:MAG: hypothetical protein ACRCZO_07100, partial [Cetobacterium sp.]
DCNVRNSSGFGSDIGTSVVVFNTNWQDLVLHIDNLIMSLSADNFSICGVNVDIISSDMSSFENSDIVGEISACTTKNTEQTIPSTSNERERVHSIRGEISACTTKNTEQSIPSTSNERERVHSIRGSFHQGDSSKFHWAGRQCVAISLSAMALHSVHSVFSWKTSNLDNVLTEGDNLYSSLHESGSISDPTEEKLLCITDLPQQYAFHSNAFQFEYGDFVSGFVDVVDGEFILSGACVTLIDGLHTMFEKYATCFFTLNGNTCAIIKQNGQFALVDSHARSTSGMVDGNGFSVVVYHKTLSSVLRHIQKLSACFGGNLKSFEITGVCVQVKSNKPTVIQPRKQKCVGKKRIFQFSNQSLEEKEDCPVVKKHKQDFKDNSEISEKKSEKEDCPVVKTHQQDFKDNSEISEKNSESNVNSDIVCLGNVTNRIFHFNPLCHEVKQKISNKLHVELQGENVLL